MPTKISMLVLLLSVGGLFSSTAGSAAESRNIRKSPRPVLKRLPGGSFEYKGGAGQLQPVYNPVAERVSNRRCLQGGGRKIIRHDCLGEDPSSIEVVYTRDAGGFEPRVFDALSTDNGVTWLIIPIELDPPHPEFHEMDHVIDFSRSITSEDLTCVLFTQYYTPAPEDSSRMMWTEDIFKCMQAFNPPVEIRRNGFFPMLAMVPSDLIYLSYIDIGSGNPYTTFFRYSTDGGSTWGEEMNITDTMGASGFDMAGMDGPLMIDADGDFIAALAMVVLDDSWAETNGFLRDVSYPAYTQSTDGGHTWGDLRLIFGNDGSAYPHGHSGNAAFDDSVFYIGGVQDAAFTALNSCGDNVAITSDGLVHLTFTMRDTTFGYVGVWHVIVDNFSFSFTNVGYPEDPLLSGESGVASMPAVATTSEGHVVVSWTELVQPSGISDICMQVVPSGELEGDRWNVTQTETDDETYQRLVDVLVPTGHGDYYCDWLLLYFDPSSGNSIDSTLWHMQCTVYIPFPGVEGDDVLGPGVPGSATLDQNYPNPFNPVTTITLTIPGEPGTRQHVSLNIYDLRGRSVRKLIESDLEPGRHSVVWEGRDNSGQQVSSGFYLYTLKSGGRTFTKKMVVLE